MVIQPILISMVNRCVSQWVKFTHQTIGIFLCVVFCDCKTKDRVKSFEKHERMKKEKKISHHGQPAGRGRSPQKYEEM